MLDNKAILCYSSYYMDLSAEEMWRIYVVCIENTLLTMGIYTSWRRIRQILKTHQVCTILLRSNNGYVLNVGKASLPQPEHIEMYKLLNIPLERMVPKKLWTKHMGKIVTKKQPNYLILQHFGP
jgi:hypothetical protein